jgi:nitrogen regulatory protein P-II 1
MKEIKAIIRHERLEAVRDALERLGVPGMTITEVKGFGHQRGYTETYRGAKATVYFRPKLELVTVVEDSLVDAVIDAIADNARTEEVGDGKIFVKAVEQVRRIRTGETGGDAL